jgi:hypothetical protein
MVRQGGPKIQVAQASNSAEALTQEGQQVYIQLANSLQTKDLEATDPTLRWFMQLEGSRASFVHRFPGSLTTNPSHGLAVCPPPSSCAAGLYRYSQRALVRPLHQIRAGGLA